MTKRTTSLERVVALALRLSTLDKVRLLERVVPTIESELASIVTAPHQTRSGKDGDIALALSASASGSVPGTSGGPVPGGGAFFDPTPSLEELAAQQGVKPVSRFEDLLGDFWPEDESADDFIAAVRAWRREGG